MAKILIAYDLNQPGRDYARLIERIKQLGTWCHPVESVWIVVCSATALEVRDDLLRFVDHSSKLLVLDATVGQVAWSGMAPEVTAWLNAN